MGPKIGIIGSGAIILGDIVVGDNVRIGINAAVLKDVLDNSIAVRIPAEIIKIDNKVNV